MPRAQGDGAIAVAVLAFPFCAFAAALYGIGWCAWRAAKLVRKRFK